MTTLMRRILGLACMLAATGVYSQPVLERLAAGGNLVVGYRETSVPFSYVDPASGKPVGYAIDLCQRLAEVVRKKTGRKQLGIDWVPVTGATRLTLMEQGKIDLECGSTTNNAERRQRVAFTLPHFITGARLLVRANSPIERMEDLQGKTLVSTKGTTPLQAAMVVNRERQMGIRIVEVTDDARAVEMVDQGEADAFVMDDVLLFGLAANRPDPKALKVVGRFITTEPLAIMLPKNDPDFKKLIDDEMRRLITSREIHAVYDHWFMRPIPPRGVALNLPVSYLLREFWKYPTDQVPF